MDPFWAELAHQLNGQHNTSNQFACASARLTWRPWQRDAEPMPRGAAVFNSVVGTCLSVGAIAAIFDMKPVRSGIWAGLAAVAMNRQILEHYPTSGETCVMTGRFSMDFFHVVPAESDEGPER